MMCGKIFPAVLLAGLSIICGCSNIQGGQAAADTVAVEAVHSGAVCSGQSSSPQAVWIHTQQQLEGRWKRMHGNLLGGTIPPVPQVDWASHGILMVHMGQKPTGGYALKLAGSNARLQGGVAFVDIHWIEPPAGAIVSMAITSPCLLVKIKIGAYRSVVIQDPSGRRRAMVDLPG